MFQMKKPFFTPNASERNIKIRKIRKYSEEYVKKNNVHTSIFL